MGNKPSDSSSSSSSFSTSSTSSSSSSVSSSSTSSSGNCQFCGGILKETSKIESGIEICKRCGGSVPRSRKKIKITQDGYARLDQKDKDEEEKFLPVKRMHVLPFKETLTDPDLKEEELLKNFIIPFFQSKRPVVKAGERFQYKEIDFKIVACNPPEGRYNDDTKIRAFGEPLSALNKITKLHCVPVKTTLSEWKSDGKRYTSQYLFENYAKPYFTSESRYITEGDIFVQDGVQFKIIAADPKSGEVTKGTKIFTDGDPLEELKKAHILPIFETLPNSEKKITAPEVFEKYLSPWLAGRFRYISQDEEIDIDGVDFKVVATEPSHGVVTNFTQIYADGEPIKYDDIKRQQMLQDEEMARRLQQQESAPVTPALVLQSRLEDMLRRMPPNDPHRPMIQRIYTSLSVPYGSRQMDPAFLTLLAALQGGAPMGDPNNAAALPTDIEALPTRVFQPRKHSTTPEGEKKESEKEADELYATCRICLCDYEAGEELRTLPCFHSYHKGCIDKWLQRNRKCPICKNPITSA